MVRFGDQGWCNSYIVGTRKEQVFTRNAIWWVYSLLVSMSKTEKLGVVSTVPTNARELLGIDIYVAKVSILNFDSPGSRRLLVPPNPVFFRLFKSNGDLNRCRSVSFLSSFFLKCIINDLFDVCTFFTLICSPQGICALQEACKRWQIVFMIKS